MNRNAYRLKRMDLIKGGAIVCLQCESYNLTIAKRVGRSHICDGMEQPFNI